MRKKITELDNGWFNIKLYLGRKLRKRLEFYFKEVKEDGRQTKE